MLRSIICILFLFSISHAEVMDKEPSLLQNFIWGTGGSLLVIFSIKYKPWLLIFLLPVISLYFYSLFSEINDLYVGPSILKETGEHYLNSTYFLIILLFFSPIIGLYWRKYSKD